AELIFWQESDCLQGTADGVIALFALGEERTPADDQSLADILGGYLKRFELFEFGIGRCSNCPDQVIGKLPTEVIGELIGSDLVVGP
ncbi:MAG: hypothetical protein VB912_09060, partial [Pirellulaceae bacterium]